MAQEYDISASRGDGMAGNRCRAADDETRAAGIAISSDAAYCAAGQASAGRMAAREKLARAR